MRRKLPAAASQQRRVALQSQEVAVDSEAIRTEIGEGYRGTETCRGEEVVAVRDAVAVEGLLEIYFSRLIVKMIACCLINQRLCIIVVGDLSVMVDIQHLVKGLGGRDLAREVIDPGRGLGIVVDPGHDLEIVADPGRDLEIVVGPGRGLATVAAEDQDREIDAGHHHALGAPCVVQAIAIARRLRAGPNPAVL